MPDSDQVQQGLNEFARQVAKVAEAAGKMLRPFLEQQERLAAQIVSAFEPLTEQLKQVQARLAPLFEQISRAFDELPARTRTALQILAVNGWYPDPALSFPELFAAAEAFNQGDATKGHDRLCDHFDLRLDEIEGEVCQKFPLRARVLKAAFAAHRRGEYALTVPVFLAQADGICQEFVGVQLYKRRDGMPQLAAHLGVVEPASFLDLLLHPLVEPMPVSAGPEERARMPDVLNRHAVLHGEAVDYDTRVNSCRALSLLTYVSWVLDERRRDAA